MQVVRPVLSTCIFFATEWLADIGQSKERDYAREQRNGLHEGGGDEHGGTDIVRRFRLASNTFCCAFTNLADADSGTYSR